MVPSGNTLKREAETRRVVDSTNARNSVRINEDGEAMWRDRGNKKNQILGTEKKAIEAQRRHNQ